MQALVPRLQGVGQDQAHQGSQDLYPPIPSQQLMLVSLHGRRSSRASKDQDRIKPTKTVMFDNPEFQAEEDAQVQVLPWACGACTACAHGGRAWQLHAHGCRLSCSQSVGCCRCQPAREGGASPPLPWPPSTEC